MTWQIYIYLFLSSTGVFFPQRLKTEEPPIKMESLALMIAAGNTDKQKAAQRKM